MSPQGSPKAVHHVWVTWVTVSQTQSQQAAAGTRLLTTRLRQTRSRAPNSCCGAEDRTGGGCHLGPVPKALAVSGPSVPEAHCCPHEVLLHPVGADAASEDHVDAELVAVMSQP